jgi:predicted alpha-1,2-mannosidase
MSAARIWTIARCALGLALGAVILSKATAHAGGTRNLGRFVNPFVGTDAGTADVGTGGGAGNTFPGVVLPFGMLQWSPDTYPSRINSPGGYTYGDTQIRGFSLTHASGVGCPILQDIPFLPTTAPVTASPALASSYDVRPIYVPSFSHQGERAQPGYYRVRLDTPTGAPIRCELTATTRTGLGHFVYPPTPTASMLINAGGSAMANGDAVVQIDPPRREVSGWVESGQFCYQRNRYKVFFVAEFSRPFGAFGTWQKQVLSPGATSATDHADDPFHLRPITGLPNPPSTSNGAQAGAYVTFDTTHDAIVQVRVAISFVSVENARENLVAENPSWDFAAVRRAARDAWNDALNRIQVRGGPRADTRTFYTMLYHALLAPHVFSDVNDEYIGMDQQVRTAAGFTPYATFSGWDIYRSEMPLLAILFPDRTSDMVASLLAAARESGWLPKWSLANGHTNTMVGDPAAPIIASAYAFGATAFDQTEALQAMVKGATQTGMSPNAEYVERAALPSYLGLGYVPHDGTETSTGASTSMFGTSGAVWGSAATTLEYTTADFAIARYAAALGETTACETFLERSGNWRNLFNPASGHVQPRFADGSFTSPFDPASGEGYAEGSAAQYTWMVPYDLSGLAGALGGPAAATERLDAFFTELNAGPTSPFAFLGNEPTAQTPWIYDWLGAPYKTQDIVRRAILTLFDATPGGYPGNDDAGQMSSWYVFGALGLYPAIPGVDVLALASPLFRQTELHLAGGTVTIVAPNARRGRPYVRGLLVNGAPHDRPWIRFADVAAGAELTYDLSDRPEPSWGSAPTTAPPSFPPTLLDSCAATTP